MMNIQENMNFLEGLAKGITAVFGSHCEVAIHDLSNGYESTIIAIENGYVTGRRVGDGASEAVLQALNEGSDRVEDQPCYLARTKEGRIIKASSVYIRNEKGEPIGLFGINYDITDLIMAQHTIETIVSTGDNDKENEEKVTISTNVNDLLDQLIVDADDFVGKPVAMMSKDDKTSAIQYLSDRGAFLIKKAGDKVSKHYDISKYTLYNYMDAET